MIAFVDAAPEIEPHGEGFMVTLISGGARSAFYLTRHAMTALTGVGGAKLRLAMLPPDPPIGLANERKRRKGPIA